MTAQSKLLVVDDEPSLQDIVATSMRFLGYDVSVAATGREAVRVATDVRPDLIILDIMLPDFDGLEVMRRLRTSGLDSGVVFLSARDAPADKVAGLTAGGHEYVAQPFAPEETAARGTPVLPRVRPEQPSRGGPEVPPPQPDPDDAPGDRRAGPCRPSARNGWATRAGGGVARMVTFRRTFMDAVVCSIGAKM